MSEVNGLGVSKADDRRGVKALSDDISFGQMLVGALAGQ
jgi:hypothetical protein